MPRRKVLPVVTFFAFAIPSIAVPALLVVLACPFADRVEAEDPGPKQAFMMPHRSDHPTNSRKKPSASAQAKEKSNAPAKPSGKLSYLPTEGSERDRTPAPARPGASDLARRPPPQPPNAAPQSPKYAASTVPRTKGVRAQVTDPRAVASQPVVPEPGPAPDRAVSESDIPSVLAPQRHAIASSRSERPIAPDIPIRQPHQVEDEEMERPLPEIANEETPEMRPIAASASPEIGDFEDAETAPSRSDGRLQSSDVARRAAPPTLDEPFFPDDEPQDVPQQEMEPQRVVSRHAARKPELDLEELHPIERRPAQQTRVVTEDPFEVPIRTAERPKSLEDAGVSRDLQTPLRAVAEPPPLRQSKQNVVQRFFDEEPTEDESEEVMELIEQPKPVAKRHTIVAPDAADESEPVSKVVQAIQEVESTEMPTAEPIGPSKAVLADLKPVRTIELRKAVEVPALAEGDNPQLKEPADQALVMLRRRTPFHFWPVYRDPWRADRDSYPFYHNPLWFEDPNLERCGRGWGHFTTTVSALRFAANLPILPYRMTAESPCCCVRTLPDCTVCEKFGCEVYLPPWSWSAAAVQAAATIGCIYAIP